MPDAQTLPICESQLLARAQNGDMEAFCSLVSEHESRLLGQAFALCGDYHLAEELAQQTWIEAWKSLTRFNHSCRFTTWVYGILLRCHHRQLRRKPFWLIPFSFLLSEPQQLGINLDKEPHAPGPDQILSQKESSAEWRSLLAHLPQIHREVILLRYFEDASLEEIASLTGVSLGTVKTRLHHGLKKLKKMRKP